MRESTISDALHRHFTIPEEALKKLERVSQIHVYYKGEIFSKRGMSNGNEYIVMEGVARSYIHGPEGEESTLSFFCEGTAITPYIVRVNQGRSVLNLQASTELSVLVIDAKAFEDLMIIDEDIRAFGNEVLKRELIQMFDRQLALGVSSAKERLSTFRKDFPQLENKIPHAQIASYLGITTISLSRLRKELLGE